jgi:DNA-binding transcriptional ArsR family regulator
MGVRTETDIANVAAAIGDATRTKVLLALAEGRALPPSALAAEAGVGNSTISEHLTKLREAKLLTVEHDGRNRYYRLASPDVARALEQLACIARPLPVRSLRQGTRAQALILARLCYDHLAGRLGVAVMRALVEHDILTLRTPAVSDSPGNDVRYTITPTGYRELTAFGVDTAALHRRRPAIRYCVDWAEHRHHLAGALGAALTTRFFELHWIRHGRSRRVIRLTDLGREGLHATFGVPFDWADTTTPAGH